MAKFIVTTDSSSDAGKERLEELKVPFISFTVNQQENTMLDKMDEIQNKAFYQNIRQGSIFKTSQINEFQYEEFFHSVEKDNLPILHISLCEGLSNTINNARLAADKLLKEGIKVIVVDATIACLGSYMAVLEAVKFRDQDVDIDEASRIISEKSKHIIPLYTTDTLTYFARGGRLSKASAVIGSIIKLNIIMSCGATGKLNVKYKLIGQKKAWKKIIEEVKTLVINPEEQTLYCCDADNREEMIKLAEQIKLVIPFKNIEYHSMGPTIGAHTGPGLLAVFFYGQEKIDK